MTDAAKVKEIVEQQLGVKDVKIDDNIVDLGADSLDHIELIMGIEHEFKFEIDEHNERLETVRDFIEVVAKR